MTELERDDRLASLDEARAAIDDSACRCAHSLDAHEHYTRATNCAFCGCSRYRR